MSRVPTVSTSRNEAGPLAPWRFPVAVVASLALTGLPLGRAAGSGEHLDLALGRSLAAAALVWFVLGSINRILVTAEADRAAAARAAEHAAALAAATSDVAADR